MDTMIASKVKKGEYVKRKPEAHKVYRMAGYCRVNKAYQLDDESDVARCIYVKATTVLHVGFTY